MRLQRPYRQLGEGFRKILLCCATQGFGHIAQPCYISNYRFLGFRLQEKFIDKMLASGVRRLFRRDWGNRCDSVRRRSSVIGLSIFLLLTNNNWGFLLHILQGVRQMYPLFDLLLVLVFELEKSSFLPVPAVLLFNGRIR